MKEIYLDNAATTKPFEEVAKVVSEVMVNSYGNPSSLHQKGIDAENVIKEASEYFAKMLGCLKEEIIYTSGGTESNNTAIIGTAMAYKRYGNKVIVSSIEHPSVKEVYKYLEEQGFEVVTLNVDNKGYVDLEQLKEEINEDTILASIMHVNNELGTIQPLETIGEIIKNKNSKAMFHVDAVQSFAKLPINVRKANIDLLSCSAHKFHGPRGIGILYKNKNTRITNLIYGGGQQANLRSGTENVPGIAGMLTAAKKCNDNIKQDDSHILECKTYLANQILTNLEDTWINGPDIEEAAPYILNIGFKDVRSEVLLHTLESNGIYVSSGSACSTHKKEKQGVLVAIGNSSDKLDNAIRFSFSYETSIEDLEFVVKVLKDNVPMLRKFVPGGRRK